MLIPQVFFGKDKDVKRDLRKLARRSHKGESWEEIFASTSLIETDEIPFEDQGAYLPKSGMIVLNENSSFRTNGANFYIGQLFYEWIQTTPRGSARPDPERNLKFLSFFLSQPWGILCLLGQHGYFLTLGLEKMVLGKIAQYFPIYMGCGKRFMVNNISGGDFWRCYNFELYGLFVRLGVPKETFAKSNEMKGVWEMELPEFGEVYHSLGV